jgi:glycosyltransferase involved in cell wall biosynthesis
MPKVSVVIPTYNRAGTIARAVSSVLEQSYQDIEVIVVDDASNDNTEEVVRSFGDDRIRYVRHAANKGGGAARNTGIRAAKGEYIAFQDSDDEWLPGKLEKQIEVFEEAPAALGVVYTGFWRMFGSSREYIPSRRVVKKEGAVHSELLKHNFVTTPAAVVRKECFRKAGYFDEALPRFQDWELFIRISESYSFRCIDEPLLVSYVTPECITTDREAAIAASKIILEKHHESLRKNRKTLAIHHYTLGTLLCEKGEMAEGRSHLWRALWLHKLRPRYVLALIISLLGNRTYNAAVGLKRKVLPVNVPGEGT